MAASAVGEILVRHGEALFAQPYKPIQFTGDSHADTLLNDLEHYPHAFVLACLINRQVKAEKAWLVPYRFKERVKTFEFSRLVALSKTKITAVFVQPPPLHRLKVNMADIFYSAIQKINEDYSGDASQIWRDTPSSATLVGRFLEFKGAGQKIATMAANILAREFKIPVSDKSSIDVSADVHVQRTFIRLGLVRKDASIEELIAKARKLNPTYPGVLDLAVWEIGRNWCHAQLPECTKCYMQEVCPTKRNLGRTA